ncbi:MAG: hypothetical protein IPK46_09250 [Saprospiraceae bacterium]|nr:hypothetical protein [Saprospiraceae bacterium]
MHQECDINWEKREIKNKFFKISNIQTKEGRTINLPYRLDEQQEKRRDTEPSPLHSNNTNYKLVKDLFGLSSDESWRSYGSKISKAQALKKENGWEEINTKKATFTRFKSPLLIKPIINPGENSISIYFVLDQKSIDLALKTNRSFIIKSDKLNKSFFIEYPSSFNLTDFFNFITNKNKINLTNLVERKYQSSTEFKNLEYIYNQLQAE